ncbi:MAG: hypothetical protein Q8M37_01160 [Nevskia sp.]|nr:hypothetical protein [Nevskia sp.]
MKSPMLVKAGMALCTVVAMGLLLVPVAAARAASVATETGTKAAAQPKVDKQKTRKSKARKQKAKPQALDLTVRPQPLEPVISPENPDYASTMLRRKEAAPDIDGPVAAELNYKIEPLFQSEQTLQVLDTEVPVTVKLGRWKTDESKALGLSATVPLPHPAK